jgi:hypothetical protein
MVRIDAGKEDILVPALAQRFCRLPQNAFGLVIASTVGCDLQRTRLDIHTLFSRISRIDNSASGSIAPQSVKLAETQSFAISDTRNKIQTHNPAISGSVAHLIFYRKAPKKVPFSFLGVGTRLEFTKRSAERGLTRSALLSSTQLSPTSFLLCQPS